MTQTLAALLARIEARLADAGVASPAVDAEELVAFAAGSTPSAIRLARARGDETPAHLDYDVLADVVGRREKREPLQHITGVAAFRLLELAVGPGVFVPRPETELVVEQGIGELIARRAQGEGELRAADLCAGSGAIALSLAKESDARVWAVELDAAAFRYLERNIEAQPESVSSRVTAVRGDARTALRELDGTLHVVVSNPPYIPPDARPVDPEVDLHDPQVALYGLGPDGLEVPRGIAAAAARLLVPGGLFVMEHAETQGEAVRLMFAAADAFESIATLADLTGRDRMTIARRR